MGGPRTSHFGESARSRILLIGGTGQIGRELRGTLSALGSVIAPGRAAEGGLPGLDLSNAAAIRAAVREIGPQLIVNAAAYTAVDRAEDEPTQAEAINRLAPGVLAEEAQRIGAALVHYSTDYVFDGAGSRGWREDDSTEPLNVYGRTKLAGERAIQAVGVPHLIIRASWVHGAHGVNFVKTILRLAAERDRLQVVDDQIGSPTSARVIAEITARLLAPAGPDFSEWLRKHGGLLHLACAGETSWHAFALETIRQARARGERLRVDEVVPLASHECPARAVRPKNSRLDCTRLVKRFGISPPDWRTALGHSLDGILGAAPRGSAAIEDKERS